MNDTFHLTERELEVLQLCIKGKSNPEIANDLMISAHTVKAHVCSILEKLECSSRVSASVKAVRLDLVKTD